jgi:lipid-binding SYLF domain-containing protein
MFNRALKIGLIGGIMTLILAISGPAMAKFTAEEAAELDAEAKATAEKFLADTKGAKELFDNAKGILVCPKIRKAGAGVGAERGKCVLTSGATERLYYQSTALKAGLIVGVSSHAMILLMNTDEALAKFTSGKREWEFGVDASVAVAKIGAGGDIDTTNLKRDFVSFIFGDKGLIADVTWEGSRFKKLDVE